MLASFVGSSSLLCDRGARTGTTASLRPVLRSRQPTLLFGPSTECNSNVCWALRAAKPEQLSPEQLQAQFELLQRKLQIAEAVQAGRPLPELAPLKLPTGC